MDQRILEIEGKEINCEFCTQTFKSTAGLWYHIHKKHWSIRCEKWIILFYLQQDFHKEKPTWESLKDSQAPIGM